MWWVSMFDPKAEAEEQNERLVKSKQTKWLNPSKPVPAKQAMFYVRC